MLNWSITFFILALVAGIFGFSDVAAGASSIGKVLFVVFLVLFLISFVTGRSHVPHA